MPENTAAPTVHNKPFAFAAVALLACALVGISAVSALPEIWGTTSRLVVLSLSVLFIPLAFWFYTYPTVLAWKMSVLYDLPTALNKVTGTVTDLETVRKESYKMRSSLDSVYDAFQKEKEQLEHLHGELVASQNTRRQHDEELMALRREKTQVEARLKQWRQTAIEYLDELSHALTLPDMAPQFYAAQENNIKIFAAHVQPLGIALIRPLSGERFDERVHEAAGVHETAEMEPGQVWQCQHAGYYLDGQPERKARVVVTQRPRVIAGEPTPQAVVQQVAPETRSAVPEALAGTAPREPNQAPSSFNS